jgi:hypothetical protein
MISEPHRGVIYTVADNGNGTWRWTLHPEIVPNTVGDIIKGEVSGSREDAIAAARTAIDKSLDGPSN